MRRFSPLARLLWGSLLLCVATLAPSRDRRDKRYEEPKPQILALPRELPMVLATETAGVRFYTPPLLKTGGLTVQIRHMLNDLLRQTHGSTVIKLRAFVAGPGDSRRVREEVSDLFTRNKVPLPVLTILQVGGLGYENAQVALEAVLASGQTLNPQGLVFFPGDEGSSFDEVRHKLQQNAAKAAVGADDILSCTCFVPELDSSSAANAQVQQAFPKAAVTVVQAQRDPIVRRIMCQAVARSNSGGGQQLSSEERAARVQTAKVLFTGLQLSFGNYLDDAKQAFERLRRIAETVDNRSAPVEVNAFALDLTAAASLRKTTSIPASRFVGQTVEGLPSMDAAAGIEAVLASDGP